MRLIALVAVIGMLFLCGFSQAAPVMVPPDLSPGDQYRLVFASSTTRDALSSDIKEYNAFVQAVADASSLATLGQTWKVIGSTATVDARDNTSTNPFEDGTGVPIYRLDGGRVADDNADLWDGNGIDMAIKLDEEGNEWSVGQGKVWTGTDWNGTSGSGGASLGAGQTFYGRAIENLSPGWINSNADQSRWLYSFYGSSGILTVVPEPSTALLLAMCVGACLWRRRQVA